LPRSLVSINRLVTRQVTHVTIRVTRLVTSNPNLNPTLPWPQGNLLVRREAEAHYADEMRHDAEVEAEVRNHDTIIDTL